MSNIKSKHIGYKVKVSETIATHNGAIYESTVLKIKDVKGDKVMVECPMGKIYWLNEDMVSFIMSK